MTNYYCIYCGSEVHSYEQEDNRANCEGCNERVPVTDDPTPYCHVCNAWKASQCGCGPIKATQ